MATLAHSIKCLAKQAYTGEHESLLKVVAKDCFVDALNESDTRFEVLKAQPETIDEALKVAARMDELKVAERLRSGSGHMMRVIKREESCPPELSELEL